MDTRSRNAPLAGLLAASTLLVPGCRNLEEMRAAADQQVYALVAARRAQLGSSASPLVVEPPADARAVRLRAQLTAGDAVELEPLDLVDCLELAAESNRAFQERRERLYLAALDLTFERYRYSWLPTAAGGASVGGDLVDADTLEADSTLGLTRLFSSGALVIGSIGLGLFESLLSSDDEGLTSNFALSITQPILAGTGSRIVLEPLTQAERSLVYEVRSFERFRRTLAVDVATRFYRLIQARDSLSNEIANAESLVRVAERNEALGEAGRLREIQVDQARQDVFGANNRVIDARQDYQSQIDDFALFLGLPVGTPIELDADALIDLTEAGLEPAGFGEDVALELALQRRLDLANARGRIVDAERQVMIAADAIRSVLDLNAGISGTSNDGKPFSYGSEDVTWDVGFGFDLPADRFTERNVWRAATIALQAAKRASEELGDVIRVSVRDALRELASRRQAYQIQDDSVALSERRVESVRLFLEAGEAQTRDLLEAQDDLVAAQNARTRALIDYRIALLALWRDTELLAVSEQGLGALPLDTTVL